MTRLIPSLGIIRTAAAALGAATVMLPAAAQPSSATAPLARPSLPEAAAKAAKEAGAVVTESGLVYRPMKQGTGVQPAATDTVRVHYKGTFPDGKEFDSSYNRGQPAEFPLNRVIKCWTEGVQLIKVGGSARLTCPPWIAYGEKGAGNVIPANATLQFDVELLGIVSK